MLKNPNVYRMLKNKVKVIKSISKIVKQAGSITPIMLFHAFSQNEEFQSNLIPIHRLGYVRLG
jgi:hypothetical protein